MDFAPSAFGSMMPSGAAFTHGFEIGIGQAAIQRIDAHEQLQAAFCTAQEGCGPASRAAGFAGPADD